MIIFVEHKSRQDGEEGRLLLNSFPQCFENEWSSNQMVERWQGGYHQSGAQQWRGSITGPSECQFWSFRSYWVGLGTMMVARDTHNDKIQILPSSSFQSGYGQHSCASWAGVSWKKAGRVWLEQKRSSYCDGVLHVFFHH